MSKPSADSLLIGAHTSIAGGVHHALLKGAELGATTVQIFTSNQKQWHGKEPSPQEIERWKATRAETGITTIMSHDSYLINLGSNKPDLLHQSRQAFTREIKRCLDLELSFLNFHPGAATGATEEACLSRIIDSLLSCALLLNTSDLRLLIETTAGQGTVVGYCFEHLGEIIRATQSKLPIGVCIDTCHIFAAGYDIRTKKGWDKVLADFDQKVGLDHLYALHVNDSLHPLGSRKDRHASLGKGDIGLTSFQVMMTHPKLKTIPKYLETPFGDTMWKEEIALLRTFSERTTPG